MYIWQHKTWPQFSYSLERLAEPLATARYLQGYLQGKMSSLGMVLRDEASLITLTENIVQSSAIEGEFLHPESVRSSLAQRLGLEFVGTCSVDRHVDGMVDVMLDAVQNYAIHLSATRLWGWHAALFPTGYSGLHPLKVGAWRDDRLGPMQVVSGGIGREKIHFTAPPAASLPNAMDTFLQWFDAPASSTDPILKAGLAHLYFITLHPFGDGNGRIARAISDMALARADATWQQFYSLSAQIQRDRTAYYDILEHTQKGDVDVTDWLEWFLHSLTSALQHSQATLKHVLYKAKAWDKWAEYPLNARQKNMLNRLLNGFEGKCTATKWAKITKSSQDTAQRDIKHLIEVGILHKAGEGRSTAYTLCPVQDI